jgi:ABC-type protease/lipase transport system fused ATPase/permease subunit
MRKRSRYRPKGVIMDTIGHVLGGFAPVREHGKSTTLKIKNHQALASMVAGTGCRDDIDILIAAMNVAEALAIVASLGDGYRAEITAAQDAIVSMGKRGVAKSRFLFTGPELTAMNLGMEVHDAQLDACTIAQLEKALDFVARELRAKRARAIA